MRQQRREHYSERWNLEMRVIRCQIISKVNFNLHLVTWPNQVERFSIADGLGDGINDEWQVSTNVVHEEQE